MKAARITIIGLVLCAVHHSTLYAAVTQVEGQAGGGLVPWALISSGKPTVSTTWVDTGDYTLSTIGGQAGIYDRVEVSFARIMFDPGEPHAPIGHLKLDIYGAKINLLPMSDTLPAISVGVQHKRLHADKPMRSILGSMGADRYGTDFYLAATKVLPLPLWEERNFLINATVRGTKANQLGILGFGSNNDDNYTAQLEASAGVFLNKTTIVGLEYRMKGDNELSCATTSGCLVNAKWNENDWGDVFIAYLPNPNFALVAAFAMFGDIAPNATVPFGGSSIPSTSGNVGNGQRGLYLQVQGNF